MVSYEDSLPLEWLPSQGPTDPSSPETERDNLFVLEAAAAVEESPGERLSEEHYELHQELRRLDAKIQVLMNMTARLLRRDEPAIPARPVRVALKAIEFRAEPGEADDGQTGTLRLQIHPAVPTPLSLQGRLVDAFESDDGRWVRFEADRLSESLRDALSRHVFRHHRRQVAASRRVEQGDSVG